MKEIEPDYSRYSNSELNHAIDHINRDKYPERTDRLMLEIEHRKKQTELNGKLYDVEKKQFDIEKNRFYYILFKFFTSETANQISKAAAFILVAWIAYMVYIKVSGSSAYSFFKGNSIADLLVVFVFLFLAHFDIFNDWDNLSSSQRIYKFSRFVGILLIIVMLSFVLVIT